MIPTAFLNSNDDYIEKFRRFYYPKLHSVLTKFGGYGIGVVTEKQYVTTVKVPAEKLEPELVNIGFQRNPIAAFKSHHSDDRKSIGSWRLLPGNDPESKIAEGKQLHVTLLPSTASNGGVDVYAHYEYDWEKHPAKHLRATNFEVEWAVDYTNHLISEYSYVKNFQK